MKLPHHREPGLSVETDVAAVDREYVMIGGLSAGKLTISPEIPVSPMSEGKTTLDEGTPMLDIQNTPQSPSNVASSSSDSLQENIPLRVTNPDSPVMEQRETEGSPTVNYHSDKGKGRAQETDIDEERQRANLLDEYHRIQETCSHYKHQMTNEGSS